MDELREELGFLTEEELDAINLDLDRLLAAYDCQRIYNIAAWYHDDQHPGELQKNYNTAPEGKEHEPFIRTPDRVVVDSLEGNTLMQPRHTFVIEVNEDCTQARALGSAFGYEALSKYREEPMAIWSMGIVPGIFKKEGVEWRQVSGGWQRIVKANIEKSWIYDMQYTNMRPPLSPEQDAQLLGRYAYKKERVRKPFPAPPEPDTFKRFPDISDDGWKYKYASE